MIATDTTTRMPSGTPLFYFVLHVTRSAHLSARKHHTTSCTKSHQCNHVTGNDDNAAETLTVIVHMEENGTLSIKLVVTEVYSQGSCGVCWAITMVETIKSMNAIATGQLINLTEEDAIVCNGIYDMYNGGGPGMRTSM